MLMYEHNLIVIYTKVNIKVINVVRVPTRVKCQ